MVRRNGRRRSARQDPESDEASEGWEPEHVDEEPLPPRSPRDMRSKTPSLQAWFENSELEQYAEVLIAKSGAESLKEFRLLTEEDLRELAQECRMTKVARRKLIDNIYPRRRSLTLIFPAEHKSIEELSSAMQKGQGMLKEHLRQVALLRKSADATKQFIRSRFQEISRLLVQEEEGLVGQVQHHMRDKLEALKEQNEDIALKLEMLKKVDRKCHETLVGGEFKDMAQRKKHIMAMVNKVLPETYLKKPINTDIKHELCSSNVLLRDNALQRILPNLSASQVISLNLGDISTSGNLNEMLAMTCRQKSDGTIDLIPLLLGLGAESSHVLDDGTPVLHLAAQYAGIDAVRLLLEHRADIGSCDRAGVTTLMAAARNKDLRASQLRELILANADLNAVDAEGNGPLAAAAAASNQSAIAFLAEAGLPVDAANAAGKTPLMACLEKDPTTDTVRCLLELKADVNAAARDGTTALQLLQAVHEQRKHRVAKTSSGWRNVIKVLEGAQK